MSRQFTAIYVTCGLSLIASVENNIIKDRQKVEELKIEKLIPMISLN